MKESDTKLKRLRGIIESWIYDEKAPKMPKPMGKIPPAYRDYLVLAYNDMIMRGMTVTSWEPIIYILEKCGFRHDIDEYGVQWTFYVMGART